MVMFCILANHSFLTMTSRIIVNLIFTSLFALLVLGCEKDASTPKNELESIAIPNGGIVFGLFTDNNENEEDTFLIGGTTVIKNN